MKVKINKKFFSKIIILIIGIIIGFIFNSAFFNKFTKSGESVNYDIPEYISTIKNEKSGDEKINDLLTKLSELEIKLASVKFEKCDLENNIMLLKNELNEATEFEYGKKIYGIDENESHGVLVDADGNPIEDEFGTEITEEEASEETTNPVEDIEQ